jgi:hypothetical protein
VRWNQEEDRDQERANVQHPTSNVERANTESREGKASRHERGAGPGHEVVGSRHVRYNQDRTGRIILHVAGGESAAWASVGKPDGVRRWPKR